MQDQRATTESAPVFRSAKIVGSAYQQLIQHREESREEYHHAPTSTTASKRINGIISGWDVPSLTKIGPYYPLGFCKVFLAQNRLSNILRILPEVFQKMSLRTIFRDSPVSAICYSMDNVELEISFFAGRTREDELIVEIERKAGDSIAFHKYAGNVMNAIVGQHETNDTNGHEVNKSNNNTNEETEQTFAAPFPFQWNQRILQVAQSMDEAVRSDHHNFNGALETAWCMLTTDRYDVQRLGLESLIHMTDPNKSGLTVAAATAKCLLMPVTAKQQFISEGIFSTAQTSNDDNNFADLSLVIVAQILAVAAQIRLEIPPNSSDTINDDLVGWLLEKVNDMQSNPHRAYFAVQALVAMCEWFPSLRTYMNTQADLVEEAFVYGDSCHFALAMASRRLLVCLQA